ncbi:hypothetical protein [Sediminitomix flava]|uniref:Uncharacterized protein n=1 Tax=Sediminitomix flava TaxID=379075 RepID=A0A315ZHL5_SEDFL|nr:hypothetical protein [Sediminitomix flava]PWJ44693.1 hypothetical protein BC781_1011064 [Sediminitomix flava]
MKKNVYAWLFAFLIGTSANVFAKDIVDPTDRLDKKATIEAPTQDIDIINEVLQSIPSPLEISSLIKDENAIYNRSTLSVASNVSRYNTQFKKALNLGIYGTDLGYSNIYGKTQDALSYLNSVQKLAEDLGIGQFFDYELIKELAETSNIEELVLQTTLNFEKINFHLREQRRENISLLSLTGGWIEAVYLTTMVNQRLKSAVLNEKIADQRIVLDQLLLVLDAYSSKPDFPELISDLNELKKVYDAIEIEEIEGETVAKEVDGILVAESSTVYNVKATDADIQKISSLIKSIRSKIIQ